MAIFTREELSKRINDLEIDENIKMSLIEDITDSIVDRGKEYQELEDKYSSKEKEYNDLYSKYKERFFSSNDDEIKDEKKIVEEIDNKENPSVIDVKEIF